MRVSLLLLAAATAAALPARAHGQRTAAERPARLTVFLDCQTSCDTELARTEITYVDWVRDRAVADVHVLITSQTAGAGGEELTLGFFGQRALTGRGDTLTVTHPTTGTDDERRRAVVRTLALGLVQFAARTASAREIEVSAIEQQGSPESRQLGRDRWNFWVFELGVDGSVRRQQLEAFQEMQASFESNRTTADWKTEVDLSLSYSDSRTTAQTFDDSGAVISEEVFTNLQRNWELELLLVRSLSANWSAGLRGGIASNTFRNQRQAIRFAPAVEYNLFPYSESTRRRFTLQYGAGYDIFYYIEPTIFDREREALPMHFFEASFRTKQAWGSTDVSVEHRNYLTDRSKRNTELQGELSVRLFRGFNLELRGNYNWIHDQLYIAKGEQDPTDVLLRRRALLTGFESSLNVGISYTFGSIFNNVVNPRF